MSCSGPNVPPSAVNPIMESPYIPSSESTTSRRSYSPDHPAERVADSSMPHSSLAMQYVNHSNLPSNGYAYAEHGRGLHGVTDVDVDEKPHLVYETMTDLQQTRQRMMNGGSPQPTYVDKYAGIPNKPVKQRNCSTAKCMAVVIWNFVLFVLVVGAFALSAYNFFSDGNSTNVINTVTPTEAPSDSSLIGSKDTDSFAQLNQSVAELRAMFELHSTEHENRYQQLNNTIFTAVESVKTVSAANELDLTSGCGAPITATCVIDHNNVNTPPASATCETPEEPLDVPGFRNVNIYCSIDNSVGETNPVTSTLNIFSGEVSCLCSLVALTAPIASPGCKLTIQRCPDTIRLNTTNMQ